MEKFSRNEDGCLDQLRFMIESVQATRRGSLLPEDAIGLSALAFASENLFGYICAGPVVVSDLIALRRTAIWCVARANPALTRDAGFMPTANLHLSPDVLLDLMCDRHNEWWRCIFNPALNPGGRERTIREQSLADKWAEVSTGAPLRWRPTQVEATQRGLRNRLDCEEDEWEGAGAKEFLELFGQLGGGDTEVFTYVPGSGLSFQIRQSRDLLERELGFKRKRRARDVRLTLDVEDPHSGDVQQLLAARELRETRDLVDECRHLRELLDVGMGYPVDTQITLADEVRKLWMLARDKTPQLRAALLYEWGRRGASQGLWTRQALAAEEGVTPRQVEGQGLHAVRLLKDARESA